MGMLTEILLTALAVVVAGVLCVKALFFGLSLGWKIAGRKHKQS